MPVTTEAWDDGEISADHVWQLVRSARTADTFADDEKSSSTKPATVASSSPSSPSPRTTGGNWPIPTAPNEPPAPNTAAAGST